jgi:DNA invertase Pin-like site-specific DNA recombinase/DNA-binding transcriptional MerR regulator
MSSNTSTIATTESPERPTPRSLEPLIRSVRSSKIQDCHLDRLAIVYVRQSTLKQVMEHSESRERQYDLASHAVTLGWPQDRVVVIDEDQGRSGTSADRRTGFQRLLAELALDHVGVILGLEMSRLARSSKDWHHLLELCALFGTLLGDQDGLYNPTESNDRLLLGLKGTMSEFELFTMRNRLTRGRLHKAERGELVSKVPMGYVRTPAGEVVLDPDEQVRDITHLIFDKFDELGTVYAVVRDLVKNGVSLGVRLQSGPRQGELAWSRPEVSRLVRMLHHPIYAGAYAYGRETKSPRESSIPHVDMSPTPEQEWKVLIRDRRPAYITWERYLANRERLRNNRSTAKTPGIARHGSALLSGILVCGRCGQRMGCHYRHAQHPFYICRDDTAYGQPRNCRGLTAASIDAIVRQQVLRALEPSVLELSLQAINEETRERQQLDRAWKQRVDRAQYEAGRAERQYRAVDPENRLVAKTLEQQWEESLRSCQRLQDDYDRFVATRPPQLTEEERDRITALSQSIPELWNAPSTTNADRKAIIRCVVDHVVVHVVADSNQAQAEIHWQGGFLSRVPLQRSVKTYREMDNYEQFLERITELRKAGYSAAKIATTLNEEKFVTVRGKSFSTSSLMSLLARKGLGSLQEATSLAANEWTLGDLSRALGLAKETLRGWTKLGWVKSRQTPTQRFLILWADESEMERLRRLAALVRPGRGRYPDELTTPK